MIKQYETDPFCLCHNKYTTSISIFASTMKKSCRNPHFVLPYPLLPMECHLHHPYMPPPSIELKSAKLRILAHRTRLLPNTAPTPTPWRGFRKKYDPENTLVLQSQPASNVQLLDVHFQWSKIGGCIIGLLGSVSLPRNGASQSLGTVPFLNPHRNFSFI